MLYPNIKTYLLNIKINLKFHFGKLLFVYNKRKVIVKLKTRFRFIIFNALSEESNCKIENKISFYNVQ